MMRSLLALILTLATVGGPGYVQAQEPALPPTWPHMNGHPIANASELLEEATEAFFRAFSAPPGAGCYFIVDRNTGEVLVAAVDCFPVNSEGIHGVSFDLRLMTPIDPPPPEGAPIYLGLDPNQPLHPGSDNAEYATDDAIFLFAGDLERLDPPEVATTWTSTTTSTTSTTTTTTAPRSSPSAEVRVYRRPDGTAPSVMKEPVSAVVDVTGLSQDECAQVTVQVAFNSAQHAYFSDWFAEACLPNGQHRIGPFNPSWEWIPEFDAERFLSGSAVEEALRQIPILGGIGGAIDDAGAFDDWWNDVHGSIVPDTNYRILLTGELAAETRLEIMSVPEYKFAALDAAEWLHAFCLGKDVALSLSGFGGASELLASGAAQQIVRGAEEGLLVDSVVGDITGVATGESTDPFGSALVLSGCMGMAEAQYWIAYDPPADYSEIVTVDQDLIAEPPVDGYLGDLWITLRTGDLLMKAAAESYARYEGAVGANDAPAAILQLTAARSFVEASASLLENHGRRYEAAFGESDPGLSMVATALREQVAARGSWPQAELEVTAEDEAPTDLSGANRSGTDPLGIVAFNERTVELLEVNGLNSSANYPPPIAEGSDNPWLWTLAILFISGSGGAILWRKRVGNQSLKEDGPEKLPGNTP